MQDTPQIQISEKQSIISSWKYVPGEHTPHFAVVTSGELQARLTGLPWVLLWTQDLEGHRSAAEVQLGVGTALISSFT